MLLILRKIGIIILTLGINLYIVSFLNNKIIARTELRRGFKGFKRGSTGFPFSSSLKYIAKNYTFSIWDVIIFVLSLSVWAFLPISYNISLVESDFNLIAVIIIYILIIIFRIFSVSYSSYGYIISDSIKRINQIFSLMLPMFFCILSVAVLNSTLNFRTIINSQYQLWNIAYQPVGFVVFFTSIVLQIKLLNLFDINQFTIEGNIIKEGEGISKLVHRFSGYIIIFFTIILFNTLYLGGWEKFYMIRGDVMVVIKFYIVFVFLIIFERSISNISNETKIINLSYKILLPLSVFNLLLTIVFYILRNVYSLV